MRKQPNEDKMRKSKKIYYKEPEYELTVDPSTDVEEAWLRKLGNLLNNCPTKRIELVTIGDPTLAVVDNTHLNFDEMYDMQWEGNLLATLSFHDGPKIAGMCG